jgi:hypothetical protein
MEFRGCCCTPRRRLHYLLLTLVIPLSRRTSQYDTSIPVCEFSRIGCVRRWRIVGMVTAIFVVLSTDLMKPCSSQRLLNQL